MMKKYLFLILFVSCSLTSFTQSTSVPFTLEDRDRIIRTEEKLESLRNDMNVKFESQQRQINDLKTMFVWGFGILISLMLFTLGYTIWDRRTALNPVRIKTETISNILRDFAKENDKFAEILRTYGLL